MERRFLLLVPIVSAVAAFVVLRDQPSSATPEPVPVPEAESEPAPTPTPTAPPFTFAVISDLHIPATPTDEIPEPARRMIAALAAEQPRFVVITGDFTNGTPFESRSAQRYKVHAWRSIRALLQPLTDAGIPVLPVAGNHDHYLPGHRENYADAFADLRELAAPLAPINPNDDAAPFSYSLDVDGVHLTLANIVDQHLDPALARWLADDLASERARAARLRIVFAHVPISSVITTPNRSFAIKVGAILAAGDADLYVAGHEHIVWDDDVRLPDGSSLRQILVGPATGFYNFGPSALARERAGCVPSRKRHLRCTMPNGGTPFELRRTARGTWRPTQRGSFTLVTIDGTTVTARVVAVDKKGRTEPFGAR